MSNHEDETAIPGYNHRKRCIGQDLPGNTDAQRNEVSGIHCSLTVFSRYQRPLARRNTLNLSAMTFLIVVRLRQSIPPALATGWLHKRAKAEKQANRRFTGGFTGSYPPLLSNLLMHTQ